MSKCRGCGAEIIWATTELSGKAVPLDVMVEKRFLILHYDADKPCVRLHDTYMPHFATCPKASEFRKNQSGKR
jgi:hypothetical protein